MMSPDFIDRRQVLRHGATAGTALFAGCSLLGSETEGPDEGGQAETTTSTATATPTATATATPTPRPPVVDDFAYPAAELPNRGWTIESGEFVTEGSVLTVAQDDIDNHRIRREQPFAAGTFTFGGVQNQASFYGLELRFIADTPSFEDDRGYSLVVRQHRDGNARRKDIEFVRRDRDDTTKLLVLTDDHGTNVVDLRVERDPETYEFTCYLNGEQVGTVADDTYTESSHMLLEFDSRRQTQRLDRVRAEPP